MHELSVNKIPVLLCAFHSFLLHSLFSPFIRLCVLGKLSYFGKIYDC